MEDPKGNTYSISQDVLPDSVQQAEALPAPVQEGHGPDEGQSRGSGREVLGLPHPFEQDLKVREG